VKAFLAAARRYWWLVVAGVVLVAGFWLWPVRRRKPVLAAELLRKAHEADVDAQLAKRQLDAEAEVEIREIRRDLEVKLERVELERVDKRAKLASDPGELLRYYRARGREL